MSLTGEYLAQLAQLVDSAQSIVIALPAGAMTDEVAAALSWAGVLRRKSKEVQIVAAEQPMIGQVELEGSQEISTELGKQNLVVSFAYVPEQVDKVSYHIGEATNRFYLTIRPKKGVVPLSQESLEVTYAGAEADLLIYIGVSDLEQLQPLSGEYVKFFRDTPSIVLSSNVPAFGTVKVKTDSVAGLCEESAQLFVQLGWELDERVSTLLLRGIEDTTDGLTSLATTPDTFETVAILLRAGARRNRRRPMLPGVSSATATTEVNEDRAELSSAVPQSEADRAGLSATPAELTNGQEVEEYATTETASAEHQVTAAPKTFADVLNRGSHPAVAFQSTAKVTVSRVIKSSDQVDAKNSKSIDGSTEARSNAVSSAIKHALPPASRYLGRKRQQNKPQ